MNRLIGLAVSPSSQEYGQALQDSFESGSSSFEIPQQWRDVDSADNTTILRTLAEVMKKQDVPIVLTLNSLDTMENQIPLDLRGKAFDDPELLKQYREFVDSTLTELEGVEILSIGIGNEADILLGDDRDRWQQYAVFFNAAKAHLEKVYPKAKVGVKFTYDGIVGKESFVRPIIEDSDCLMMTYYPVGERSVRPVGGISQEIEAVLAAYPGKVLHLNEIGYPYSRRLGSSRALQAEFVEEAFVIFDQNPRVELMNFVWLNDMHPVAVQRLKAAVGDTVVFQFLTTLGLRDHQGRPTPAFERFRAAAKVRGIEP